ncbi:probable endo-beta-1,4-glucanase B [Aspergillus udagawae]|uniref:cellulase n=1 Tax=Aspergillus udagawae TaxID=91492 RepID=A0ABQ1A737_9EURO|nr:probable endo-beta-1,4-glucanase B [Aspergillus udagawae]GFF72728.1 probable endo-beta-1,4-glucanase B [Aspergillus udagawae]GFG00448.1 probable endo-beta-1,4-glucanase B [Aspergillus udagawae]GFG23445.1 probable endo-beta-1,4-glucanase B [Aspergillus udagawae]
MRISNLIMAASAAGLVNALPVREVAKKRSSGFTWVGVNESGAEFGSSIPGKLGTDYTWPDTSKIQTLRDAGMNIFRVPFLMERLVPSSMTSTPDATYLSDLKNTVKFITDSGAYAILDPHNYGRYSGSIISSTSDFQTFWKTVASEFASNDKVIFDTNNEYHDMDQTLVLNLNQAAINGIRAAGATTQYIFVEGNHYSGAWTWTDNNDNLKGLKDPQDKIVFEMHQYLDSDGSGTSESCVSSTIGQERVQSATQWLKDNSLKGFLGEFAGGVNSQCETAVEGLLSYMSENSDVWLGAEWWSAGPWWGTYMYSLEPTSGPAYSTYLPILKKYFVSGTGSSSSSSSTTGSSSSASSTTSSSSSSSTTSSSTSVTQPTTTAPTQVQVVATSSPSSTPTPSSVPAAEVPAPAPTEAAQPSSAAPSTPTTAAASTPTSSSGSVCNASEPAANSSASGVAKHWYQCGGINWTGPTTCESGYTCVKQNAYYHQCV